MILTPELIAYLDKQEFTKKELLDLDYIKDKIEIYFDEMDIHHFAESDLDYLSSHYSFIKLN